jgi:hypothetical protein
MRKLIALFILACVFVPLAFTAMTLASIRPWILNRSFYERIVSDERLYDALFTGELPNQFNRKVFASADQLPVKALNIALREVITPEYLRTQSMNLIDQVFSFIEGRGGNFEISFDLKPVKAALAGAAGPRFAAALAAALPPCNAGEEQVAPGGRLARCVAANSSMAAVTDQIVLALPAALENTPDRLLFADPVDLRRNWPSVDWLLGATIRTGLDTTLFAVIFVAFAVGVVGAYLGGDNLRGRLKWFSSSLFFPAALLLVTGLSLATPLIVGPLRNELRIADWDGVQYSEPFRHAVTDLTVSLVQQIGNGFLLAGLVCFIIALGLLALGWMVPASERRTGKMVQVPTQIP